MSPTCMIRSMTLSQSSDAQHRTPSIPDRIGRGSALAAWIRALDATKILRDAPVTTLPAMLPQLAGTHGDRPALLGQDEQLSYHGLAARANQYARWAIARGLGKDQVACLLMPNCPDYAAT